MRGLKEVNSKRSDINIEPSNKQRAMTIPSYLLNGYPDVWHTLDACCVYKMPNALHITMPI